MLSFALALSAFAGGYLTCRIMYEDCLPEHELGGLRDTLLAIISYALTLVIWIKL